MLYITSSDILDFITIITSCLCAATQNLAQMISNKKFLLKKTTESSDIIDNSETPNFNKILKVFNENYKERFGSNMGRDEVLWSWCYTAVEITRLDHNLGTYDPQLIDKIKLLGIIFVVVLDDISDRSLDNEESFKVIKSLEFNTVKKIKRNAEDPLVQLGISIWNELVSLLEPLPNYQKYKNKLIYYYECLFRNMLYSLSIQKGTSNINLYLYRKYFQHNVHMIHHGLIDLMTTTTTIDYETEDRLIKILLAGQLIGRFGNSLTTYKRELLEGDISSDIIPIALEQGIIQKSDLYSPKLLSYRINNNSVLVEDKLKSLINAEFHKLNCLKKEINDMNIFAIDKYINGLNLLLEYYSYFEGKI